MISLQRFRLSFSRKAILLKGLLHAGKGRSGGMLSEIKPIIGPETHGLKRERYDWNTKMDYFFGGPFSDDKRSVLCRLG